MVQLQGRDYFMFPLQFITYIFLSHKADKASLKRGSVTGILLAFRQNFAEIEIKCLHSHTKCSWYIKREISSKFLQGEQTIISFQ